MSHPLILIPRTWRTVDRLLARRFPRRRATVPPASWLGELMEKRFGALILCAGCALKYGDAIRRLAYARHPDMKATGNACDACKRMHTEPLALWFKEEHRYPTAQEHADQSRRFGIAGAPHLYDARRRVAACTR